MTAKTKTVLLRFVRSTAAVAVAGLIGFLSGPDALSLVPTAYAFVVTGIAIPLLVAADKWLRYGQDAGES